jgi:hypothetical protein
MSTAAGWPVARVEPGAGLRSEHIERLCTGDLAAVVIPRFQPTQTCRAIVERVLAIPDEPAPDGFRFCTSFQYDNVLIERIGIAHIEYAKRELAAARDQYRADAGRAAAIRQDALHGLDDPVTAVVAQLQAAWPPGARLAQERGIDYFTGLVRRVTSGPVHRDWSPADQPGWAIAEIEHQLSWNMYLEPSAVGGELFLFHRRWEPEDDGRYRHGGGRVGYDPNVVAGAATACVRPETGDLVLLNTRYYHSIGDTQGHRRLTMSSFIGRTHDGPLILWS